MAALDLDHVSVPSGRTARLDDVSMTIDDGALVAVVGGSGSGKTSLLRAVAGLDRIENGLLRFDGRRKPRDHDKLRRGRRCGSRMGRAHDFLTAGRFQRPLYVAGFTLRQPFNAVDTEVTPRAS